MLAVTDEEARKSTAKELGERLHSGNGGLSSEEAARRLAAEGPNALPEQRVSLWLRFLRYFWGPIPWMIEVAAV
ncbi:MAG: cation-transporting P-type ATPase, partial [Gammaproteobacteria bacterium]